MKSVFRLLSVAMKYGSLIVVILNILKVAMDEIQEKFPDLLEDDDDQEPDPEITPAPAPTTAQEPAKEKKGFKFQLPF